MTTFSGKNGSGSEGFYTSRVFFIGAFVLAVLSCFAIFLPYGYHDDYRYLGDEINRTWLWGMHPDMRGGVIMGRPIAMFSIALQSILTTSVENLIWQRAFSFFVLMVLAYSFYRYLHKRLKWHAGWSMTSAFMICCLPVSMLLVQWSILAAFASLALATTFVAHWFYRKAMDLREAGASKGRWIAWLALSMFMLELSFYNYPVMGLVFCAFTYARLLFSQEPQKKLYVGCVLEVAFLSAAMVLFFLSLGWIYQPILIAIYPKLATTLANLSYHKIEIVLTIPNFFSPLYYGALPVFGGPFHPIFGDNAAYVGFGVVILLLIAGFLRPGRDRKVRSDGKTVYAPSRLKLVEAGVGFALLYPLSISPIMLSSWHHTFYRTVMCASILGILLFMFLLRGVIDRFVSPGALPKTYKWIFILLFVSYAVSYHFVITKYAFSATLEKEYVTRAVTAAVEKTPPDDRLLFNVKGGHQLDPYGLGTDTWEFQMSMFCPVRVNMREYVEYVARSLGHRGRIVVFKDNMDGSGIPGEIFNPSEAYSSIIDLTPITMSLAESMKAEVVIPKGSGAVVRQYGDTVTFDFPRGGFWGHGSPGMLEVDLKASTRLNGYSLLPPEGEAGRSGMPATWDVYISRNGNDFELVDSRRRISDWSAPFVPTGDAAGRTVRFVFPEGGEKALDIGSLHLDIHEEREVNKVSFSVISPPIRALRTGNALEFDFPGAMFVETSAPPPYQLDVELAAPKEISGYGLRRSHFVEGPDRMPETWQVLGSLDGKEYRLLAEGARNDWSSPEYADYKLAEPERVHFLRFLFNGSKRGTFRIRSLRVLFTE